MAISDLVVTRSRGATTPWDPRAVPAPGARTTEPGRVSPVRAFDRWLARRVHATTGPVGIGLTLWDGHTLPPSSSPPVGRLEVRDRRALVGLAVRPELYFGEAYMAGTLDVDGSLEQVVEALSRAVVPSASLRERVMAALPAPSSPAAARRNIHEHYDLGNAFYARWLDAEMLYTCAYFPRPTVSLEDAQIAKLDRVCRKIRLGPSDHVADLGCGWGGFARYAARQYGCRVTAFNVSREQLAYARERAVAEELADRVTFVDDDYRNLRGTYDAVVSLGMLEHVGLRQFDDLAGVLRRALPTRHGRGLLHFIGRDVARPLNPWIRRRIFPGAYPPTLGEVTSRVLAPAQMSVVDVENLRLHYARTLAHWRERFEAARPEIGTEYGDRFCRAWELYLAGSEAAFSTGWLQLYQVVFGPVTGAPPWWTRDDMLDRPAGETC